MTPSKECSEMLKLIHHLNETEIEVAAILDKLLFLNKRHNAITLCLKTMVDKRAEAEINRKVKRKT